MRAFGVLVSAGASWCAVLLILEPIYRGNAAVIATFAAVAIGCGLGALAPSTPRRPLEPHERSDPRRSWVARQFGA